ncbi:MAG TPA: hypothetical protein VK887_07945 [Pseudonocardiaceae bacterium]|nr:hypothetical protein [Pseudonocardiaceae bacterium]
MPTGLQIHMICDNYGIHKHANVTERCGKQAAEPNQGSTAVD